MNVNEPLPPDESSSVFFQYLLDNRDKYKFWACDIDGVMWDKNPEHPARIIKWTRNANYPKPSHQLLYPLLLKIGEHEVEVEGYIIQAYFTKERPFRPYGTFYVCSFGDMRTKLLSPSGKETWTEDDIVEFLNWRYHP